MKIAVPRERRVHEKRVAATPETDNKYVALGLEVSVESGARDTTSSPTADYQPAGARLVPIPWELFSAAAIALTVQRPRLSGEAATDALALPKKNALLIGMLAPSNAPDALGRYA